MRRWGAKLEACIAPARQRDARAAGRVTLAFEVADRKVVKVSVSDDGVHDPLFARCLVTAAARLTFALSAARFSHAVTIRP
jgi:hypothetical protein